MNKPRSDAAPLGRRDLLTAGTGIVAGAVLLAEKVAVAAAVPAVPGAPGPQSGSAAGTAQSHSDPRAMAPGLPNRDYQPVIVPNGAKLPFTIVNGVKVFHLIAEEVEHEFAPGLSAHCWGYNGHVHGPVIEAVELDRVRIYVTNRLPAPTSVHWHSILLPNGMDGVAGLNQKAIQPGETFKYEFTLRQSGTCMYHSHHDEMTQIALGMTGMFVIHPRHPQRRPQHLVDRDFVLMLHEWRIDPGARRPDPNEMTEFNVLTMNARAFPGTAPLVARKGERVRIRLGNLGPMDHHSIHLHGYQFRLTETDGGPLPAAAQSLDTTVLVAVGSTRTIELVADEPGDWAMHCHMTHHAMNQMGHGVPNMLGVRTGALDKNLRKVLPGYMSMGQAGMADMPDMVAMGMPVPKNSIPMLGAPGKHDYITMGGMFTVLKVRERLDSYADPGWYDNPPGTLAMVAAEEELQRDGIDVKAAARADPG